MTRFAPFALVVAFTACRGDPPAAQPGTERAACRAGSAERCDPGLSCLSELCVRAPAGDCQAVAETFTSFDLGNYAEPEARAPVVANYKATCEQVAITAQEADCIDKARDRWAASNCARRMVPQLGGTADCPKVRAKVEASYGAQAATFRSDPTMSKWFDLTMQVVQQACQQDFWPESLKTCILAVESTGGDALQRCNQNMPPELQKKMQARMIEAQKSLPH